MKLNYVKVKSKAEIEKLGSALTVVGISLGERGSEAFADWCHEKAKFKAKVPDCYLIKGKTMNSLYGLTGDNRYDDDLNIIAFRLDAFVQFQPFVCARFEVEARWLDDIVMNNAWRQRELDAR